MPNITEKRYPQVLLLGNGLNIGHGGKEWKELLKLINENPEFSENLKCPMPLQAIIVTKDHVDCALKDKGKRKDFYGAIEDGDECQKNRLSRLLTAGFDCILTTNYSYELECVAYGVKSVSDYLLERHLRFLNDYEVKRAEPKYLLHTYYEAEKDGVPNKIFHIHGEARKPDSMVLGHYYYGNLLNRYFKMLEKRGDVYLKYQKKGKMFPIRSWIDAFILGDVYILGFGYSLSEFDLWWLLNRRKRENADKGKVYFYEKQSESIDKEKLELLMLMDVNIKDMGMEKNDSHDNFYQEAIEDIIKNVNKNERNINL